MKIEKEKPKKPNFIVLATKVGWSFSIGQKYIGTICYDGYKNGFCNRYLLLNPNLK